MDKSQDDMAFETTNTATKSAHNDGSRRKKGESRHESGLLRMLRKKCAEVLNVHGTVQGGDYDNDSSDSDAAESTFSGAPRHRKFATYEDCTSVKSTMEKGIPLSVVGCDDVDGEGTTWGVVVKGASDGTMWTPLDVGDLVRKSRGLAYFAFSASDNAVSITSAPTRYGLLLPDRVSERACSYLLITYDWELLNCDRKLSRLALPPLSHGSDSADSESDESVTPYASGSDTESEGDHDHIDSDGDAQ
jgi:hypothetical protein